jgi:hypothetical protein
MSNRLVRSLALAVATCGLALALEDANASSAQYDFHLNVLTSANSSLPVPTGSGYFVIDQSLIPSTGTFALAASEFEGHIGATGFGYSHGRSIGFNAPDGPFFFLPHSDATISFLDGIATGINYNEFHTCQEAGNCRSANGITIEMLGSTFDFGLPFNDVTGTISISGPVPEPEVFALILVGLGAMGLLGRRHRR